MMRGNKTSEQPRKADQAAPLRPRLPSFDNQLTPQDMTPTTHTLTIPAGVEFRGFCKGLNQVLHKDYTQVIAELREALGITSRAGLSHYRNGRVTLRAAQAVRVQQVFNKYGITDIWDA